MCRHRFGVLDDLYIELLAEGITDVKIMGINGYQYINDDYTGMIEDRILPWTQDIPEVDVWESWDAILRDLFIIDRDGTLITRINLTSFNPDPDISYSDNDYELILVGKNKRLELGVYENGIYLLTLIHEGKRYTKRI